MYSPTYITKATVAVHFASATETKRVTKQILIGLAAGILFISGSAFAADEPTQAAVEQRPSLETLQKELVSIRADIDAAQKALTEHNKALRQKQHDIEYQDPAIVALRQELIALEKQVLEKRAALDVRIALVSALKDLERERREAFQSLQQLRNTEAAIQREITAAEHREE